MITNEVQAALTRKANSDLRLASRNNEILIGQTKVGTIRLQKQEAGYGIFWAEVVSPTVITQKAIEGSKSFIRSTLINLYQVA